MNSAPATFEVDPAASSTSAQPPSVVRSHVFGQSAAGWRIGQPLEVHVVPGRAGYLISDPVFNVFGEGRTYPEAEGDFVASLIDYYLLMAHSDEPATQAIVRHLETYVHRDQ